ncbi:efflux RND transporter periplasmic adaptor subunit [Alteromonas halophila]|uniref:Membrane protein n=1 Tax=Alteromonas halophila TaxID=516698 RepID=A0A918JF94_9ALTE|nr:efflux RND transporter periplasmic adaptor subunit [Alteromonas halophila]GGW75020.1 membrane protein [Alteromonas halophila]
MKWIKIALPIGILVVGYLAMKGVEATASDSVVTEEVDTRPTVTIEHLTTENYTVSISSYGEVTPLERTNLAAQVTGEVVSWNPDFIAGGLVERGETLFSIEKDSYEAALLQAEASLASAQAQLIQEQAQADVARREAKTLPDARVTDLYLRKPQVLSAQAAVKSAEAQLRIARRDLENCDVKAPYDALIVSRSIGKGDFVSTGTVAATLNNIETAEITFPVAGFDRPFLGSDMIGKTARVDLDAHGAAPVSAVIHRDLGTVDQATRMTHFVARIDDPYGLRTNKPVVRFGSYATLTFEGKTLDDVYRIPQELINRSKLWTLDDNNKLVSHQVKILREEGSDFLIQGQFNSEKVVMSLPEYPQEGMAVKVIEENGGLVAQRPAAK